MKVLNIAILQIAPANSQNANMEKGIAACKRAKQMGADIVLFPEIWNTGYNIPQSKSELNAAAISINSEFVNAFANLAKQLDMAIGITFLEKFEPSPRNTLCLFDRFGKNVLHYAKVHTCDFGDENVLTAGDDFYVADLNTVQGEVKVGAMICYDREFPESARILMLKGAEIVLVPNACPMEINRISQLRARAFENMICIATVNYPMDKEDCNGHSTVFDGIAYKPELEHSRDTKIFEAGEEEGIFIAEIPIDDLREYRKAEVHGNAYRKPSKYNILISEEKTEPFIRE